MRVKRKTKTQLETEVADLSAQILQLKANGAEYYRRVFETISDFAYIVRINLDGSRQPEWVTPATSRLTGFPPEAMLQPDIWRQITHPADWLIVEQQINDLLANQPADVEYRVVGADGHIYWIRDHARPEWSAAEQRVIRICGAIQDITGRKEIEQALRTTQFTLDHAADPVYWFDSDGRITYANEAATRHLGYTRAALLTLSLSDLNPNYLPAFWPQQWLFFKERGSVTYETAHRTNDGRLAQVEVSATYFALDKREMGVAFVRDITARKQAETAEREQRQLAEAMCASTAAISSSLNLEEVLDRILGYVQRVIDCDAAEVLLLDAEHTAAYVARHCSRYDPDHEYEVAQLRLPLAQADNLRTMLTTGQAVIIEDAWTYPGWVASPLTAWVRSNLGWPLVVHGETIGFLSVDKQHPRAFGAVETERLHALADQVSLAIHNARLHTRIQDYADGLERRVAERTQELAAANERLQELDRLKSKFVSDVSHELRTPAASLGLYIDLLNRGQADRHDYYLAQATSQMQRLRTMIDEILDLARLDRASTGLDPERVDLNELVAQLVDEQRPVAEAVGLTLQAKYRPDSLMVLGDYDQLLRSVRNLVANALKYAPHGEVCLTTLRQDGQVGVQVSDTGPGIDAADLPHLFERFYRGKQQTRSMVPGTGLGLAIVKEIVAAHGGTVEVESAPGKGSTFRLWLPGRPD